MSKLSAGQCQLVLGSKRSALLRSLGLLGCVLATYLASGFVCAEKHLYRYLTESGSQVQSDRLPAGAAARGYSIVNSAGDVLKVVPRQLTEAERAERDRLQQQVMAEQQERKRLRKWDHSLILRYSALEDIDDAMRRGLLKYDTRIGILRGNLQSLKSQIEQQQGSAANYLRMGRQVPESLAQQILTLRADVADVERAIVTLRQERVDAELQFHNDKERFALLLERASSRN